MPHLAKKVKYPKKWSGHEISPQVMEKLMEIELSLLQLKELHQKFDLLNKEKKWIRILFEGASTQEKIHAAMHLGKHIGLEVYRIDLSSIVSKYIGETEKNLSEIFDKAADKNWILFFDEADALFGKRTDVNDESQDRFVNTEFNYLLSRMEDFIGLSILATNFKGNIDDAFLRRFQFIINFP